MANGWSLERRQRQAELIRRWRPWERSTGPRTEEGRQAAAHNAWKGGQRQQLRELARALEAELVQMRRLMQNSLEG